MKPKAFTLRTYASIFQYVILGGLTLGGLLAHAADSRPAAGPDPKEIPVPWIKGPLGKLPGVN